MSSAKKPPKSSRNKTPGGSGPSKRSKAKLSTKRTASSTKRGPAPRPASRTAKSVAAARKVSRPAASAKRTSTAKAATASKSARSGAVKAGRARASVRTATPRSAKAAAAALRRARAAAATKSARRTAAAAKSSRSSAQVAAKAKTLSRPKKAAVKPAPQTPAKLGRKTIASTGHAASKVVKTVTQAAVAPLKAVSMPAAALAAPVAKAAVSLPGTAAKIVAALRAAQAKSAVAAKPATDRPSAVQDEANRGGTTAVTQKPQKKIETVPAPVAPESAQRPAATPTLRVTAAAAPARLEPVPADKLAVRPMPLAKAPEKPIVKPAKPTGNRHGFKTSEFIVYPAHGVGQITAIEEQEVAGFRLELFVISFIKDKMILKVPTLKVASVGMRKLAEAPVVTRALDTLTGRARVKRTMWSRRAQEYEAKINSGDLIAIAEVVRDLYRSDAQPEQSYSERQLYEAAVDRMGREIGAVNKLTETEALKLIEANLQKGPRRGKAEEPDSEDGDIEEAA